MSPTDRDPFILDRPTGGPLRARDALICVGVAALLLLLALGNSMRGAGEKMEPGGPCVPPLKISLGWVEPCAQAIERTIVLAVGKPAGWIADQLPIASAVDDATAGLSPDDDLKGPGGFVSAPATGTTGGTGSGAAAPITPEAFDAVELGEKPKQVPALKTLLVTGDSLAQPLDVQLARKLSPDGVNTIRDAHLGTGISKTDLVDWGLLSGQQVRERKPDAVVMFIGANEGFPFPAAGGKSVECCGAEWAVVYATRARSMMETYRRRGAARVYWLTLPMPRDPKRQRIARVVNAALVVAAQPFRAHVRVLDMSAVFTPGGRYRAAMEVGSGNTIVRDPDGIHLSEAGAGVAAGIVLGRLQQDFASRG